MSAASRTLTRVLDELDSETGIRIDEIAPPVILECSTDGCSVPQDRYSADHSGLCKRCRDLEWYRAQHSAT